MTDKELMLAKLEKHTVKSDSCWIFTGCSIGNGYGSIYFKGENIRAHRASYMVHHGEIAPGMFICHKCDVRRCINPDHLFMGTARDNILDCIRKGRFRGGGTPGTVRGPNPNRVSTRGVKRPNYRRRKTALNSFRLVCKRGHPLTDDNVIVHHSARRPHGERRCKECTRVRRIEYERKRRERGPRIRNRKKVSNGALP